MAQGAAYNVILPFTVAPSNIVPSTIVAGGLTVNGQISAQQFVALFNGTNLAPAYTFDGVGTSTGMYLGGATALSFSVAGTVAGAFVLRSFAGGPTIGALALLSGIDTQPVFITGATLTGSGAAGITAFRSDATTLASVSAGALRLPGSPSNTGLTDITGAYGFIFTPDADPAIMTGTPGTYAAVWERTSGTSYFKPGLLQQATTTVVPSVARSLAHVTNLIAGLTTVFVTLPTSIAGVKYTITNVNSAANTVVVNPVAADTINVFGLAKAAGASVAANLPFSSITLHCVTSTMWVATDFVGTWI